MEYNDPQTFFRLTGRAIFTPSGQSGGINLGNIEMMRIDYGVKSFDDKMSVRGRVMLRRRKYTEALPVYSIDGNQFVAPNLPLILLGTQSASDFAQSAVTGNTFTFTAAAGLTWLIGAYGIKNVVVTVPAGSYTAVLNQDYFLDTFNGTVSIPVSPVNIAPGATVVVTYDTTAFVLDQYSAFTNLDRLGQLVVFCEDDQGPPAAEIWIMTVSLSTKKGPDTDPTKFRRFTLEATVLGNPQVLHRGDLVYLGVGGDTFLWGGS